MTANNDRETAPKHLTEKEKIIACIFWLTSLAILLSYCATNTKNEQAPAENVSALEKMSVAFQGNYTETDISAMLFPLMAQQGVNPDESELERWGSVLVRMRKNSGVSEMDIMRCMKGIPKISFPDNVAMCGTLLEKLRR